VTTGAETHLESDGKAVDVDLLYTVAKGQVLYVDGFLGVAAGDAESGESVALTIDQREYQFTVPATLTVNKGDIVYVDPSDLTGHVPDDTGYATVADTGLLALFKATSDKDANNVVTGILLPLGVGA
jgi:plastocyanin